VQEKPREGRGAGRGSRVGEAEIQTIPEEVLCR